ncbi:class I SAM-dependent DNA methyltransferase [Halorubrum vacuolatum]|uniref:site-specific DNA-methyltransferase (adenine-specific) n=1 Tax=Halorubrum vacuolatum TaxID=63740 RepID=A0A238XD58_HALVU|nr:type I restriction-modification system subunit M [Halorubrum vacuolatum]SNR56610.1 type I restriction enzyme M protein [Halorubrum vacuolatum]
MSINGDNGEFEKSLWQSAEGLRGPVESAEYKHIVLGLLFLKYMSDAFEQRRNELRELTYDEESMYYCGDDDEERQFILEDIDAYHEENVFYIPEEARWEGLMERATHPDIGAQIDDAMRAIEDKNPDRLDGMLPKRYSRIPQDTLEGLLNEFSELDLGNGKDTQDEDVFGRVYEYFIKEFARQEGHRGGEFYTPKHVVELLVEILEPFEGRIFDPFCGSGGMFVQSHKFLEEKGGDESQISIYGQEVNQATWRICKMNLYLRGIDGNIQLGDSIRDDKFSNLRADTIITNPPFNMSEWGKETVSEDDPRFKYGLPPSSNANLAFLQHMLYHVSEDGMIGTVMAKGSLSSSGKEAEIRKQIVEDDLLDAIIVLSDQLFYTTEIPVSIWVLSKSKGEGTDERERKGETLFIDARDIYEQKDIKQKILRPKHIDKIASTVRSYRQGYENYEDEPGFCKVVDIDEIAENDYILIPGRYVGIEDIEKNDVPFEPKMEQVTSELRQKFRESDELQKKIDEKIREVGF